jgi:hypothetical protein
MHFMQKPFKLQGKIFCENSHNHQGSDWYLFWDQRYGDFNPNPGGYIYIDVAVRLEVIYAPPRRPIEEREALLHAATIVGISARSLIKS